jgi:hypothetical protein
MSEDRSTRDGEDAPLPDELARCESQFATFHLPPSQVDRDELLFRSGWSAGEAHASKQQPTRSPSTLRTLTWSLTSALVAASLASLVTMRLPSLIHNHDAASGGLDEMRQDGATVARVVSEVELPDRPRHLIPPQSISVRQEFGNASLLTMRDLALRGAWDEIPTMAPSRYADLQSESTFSIQPKTSRELLRELVSPQT